MDGPPSHSPADRAADGSDPRPAGSSDDAAAVLCLDTASPTVSVALASAGSVLAEEREPIARSSVRLLPMVDSALHRAGLALHQLGGLAVLAGPGSFTGLRVGMATALGLHQAAGVPTTSVTTFAALAAWYRAHPAGAGGSAPPLLAAVDVLRGEWAVQVFRTAPPPASAAGPSQHPEGEPVRLPAAELIARARSAGAVVIGFGTPSLGRAEPASGDLQTAEPDALAGPTAAELSLAPPAWDPAALTRPLYFRPPAVTAPKRPGSTPSSR